MHKTSAQNSIQSAQNIGDAQSAHIPCPPFRGTKGIVLHALCGPSFVRSFVRSFVQLGLCGVSLVAGGVVTFADLDRARQLADQADPMKPGMWRVTEPLTAEPRMGRYREDWEAVCDRAAAKYGAPATK